MISMWKMREMVDKATNLVMNYTETEAKVREATNDDPWGPSGNQMQELASFTFTYEQFPEVMGMLWKRMLQDNRTNWRRTYKSLLLLDYLIKNGSERVVTNAREHIYDLRSMVSSGVPGIKKSVPGRLRVSQTRVWVGYGYYPTF